jgi:acyl-homoserine-lactone acylase
MKKAVSSVCSFILFSFVIVGGGDCYGSSGNLVGDRGNKGKHYSAEVRWTSHGIPHILAETLPDASFGSGYAFAKLNSCVLADQLLMVRSERSRHYGPDKVSGSGDRLNLISDLFYKAMGVQDLGRAYYLQQTKENRAILDAYIAGYNKYLLETGAPGLPCAEQPGASEWAIPARVEDYSAYLVDFTWLGGPKPLMSAIVNAQPPPSKGARIKGLAETARSDFERFQAGALPGASNGWAVGRERTENGTGMLLGNPHYPWEGERRFFESHVTVPGVVNVYGATLMGMPLPGIAFNENVAWTHTVCTSSHFTFYRLMLKPGDPTQYIYDGQVRPMKKRRVKVQVRQPDGTLAPVTLTFYRSHFGPMVEMPGLDWTETHAWTIRSATDEDRGLEMRWAMAKAGSIEELKEILASYQSVNYLNTIAVDSAGNAFYADTGNVPNVTPEMLAAGCAFGSPMYLDGSRSACEWADDPAAAQNGIVAFKDAPQLTNQTYVANSNNSYWLTNTETPITMTALNLLWGREGTDIGLRPRMGLTLLEEVAGSGKRVSWEVFQGLLFNGRVMGGELLADDLAALCETDADLAAMGACDALGAWDKTDRLDSTGGHIFREFMTSIRAANQYNDLWAVPFDPGDPVATPHTLNTAGNGPGLLDALRRGVARINLAGLDLDAPLGEIQFTRRGDELIPIHGGPDADGTFNMLYYNPASNGTLLPPDVSLGGLPSASLVDQGGYLINYGSSYMQLVEYPQAGPPRAKALISYSQSTDPHSPFFSDQTHLFSRSLWRDCLFSEAQIAGDPNLTIEIVQEKPKK